MEKITEEKGLHKEWYERAKEQTLDTYEDFVEEILSYDHDYGTICHALTAIAIAMIWVVERAGNYGLTGFQGSCIMWEFIKNWSYTDNKTGLKLLDYDKLLYPQYEENFEKIITRDTWKALQNEAIEKLYSSRGSEVHHKVRDHWISIIRGEVPFGFKVKDGN